MSLETDQPAAPTTPATAAEAIVTEDRDGAPPRRARFRLSGWARLTWPATALLLILLFDLFFVKGFFSFELRDGRLHGNLINVLHRGAPVMLLSLGMTLVIATGGIDLSVGAVMAIAGAVAAVLIARPEDSAESYLRAVEAAVGRAKEQGRNRIIVAEESDFH